MVAWRPDGWLLEAGVSSMLRALLFLCVQAKDYTGLVVFCIFFGISYGMVGALQFEVLMTIVGTERFPSALGLVLLMEAIAVLLGPPGAGQTIRTIKDVIFRLRRCRGSRTRSI